MFRLFVTEIIDEEWGNYFTLTPAGYAALILIMAGLIVTACMLGQNRRKKFDTKQLVFSSMAIALGMVTSMLKLFHLPMGGSITLFSMLFICLIGYWYGLRSGLTAAVAYGLLQLIVDPFIVSLPQILVDYVLAFGALGLSGVFSDSRHGLVRGYVLGVLGRYFFSFLSGMIFFGSYAADYNMAAPVYSLTYNGIYIGAEAALTLALISIPAVGKALARIKKMALEGQNENAGNRNIA